jgi:signal transduction histidine kinase
VAPRTLIATRPGPRACRDNPGSTRDITARKRAEEQLREADRRKDEFLAMLGHELRNPLAVISSASGLLKIAGGEQDRAWCIDAIQRQLRHLVRTTDDLIDASRVTRGVITLRREPLELGPVLDRAIEAARPFLARKRHDLRLEMEAGPIGVHGDPVRLEQVFANLLDNAIRFTPEGGRIAVTVRQDAGEAVVEVRDNGIGIAAEMLPYVFDLFVQDDRSQGGLGVGLTLARTIVEMHGGRVAVASEGPRRGSVFTVWLSIPAGRDAVVPSISDKCAGNGARGQIPVSLRQEAGG